MSAWEAKHGDTVLIQIFRSAFIVRLLCGFIVDVSIQLDREALFRAIEIEDVEADAMLATELPSIQFCAAQLIPQQVLAIGGAIPEFPAALLQAGMVLNLHFTQNIIVSVVQSR